MRLVGYFAVPRLGVRDPALDFALHPRLPGRRLIRQLADLARPDNGLLPELPLVDVKYLVPITLFDRLGDLP